MEREPSIEVEHDPAPQRSPASRERRSCTELVAGGEGVTDQQFEDLTIVVGTVALWALCLTAGIYLIVTGHYGWAWIPFVFLGSGFERSPKTENEE